VAKRPILDQAYCYGRRTFRGLCVRDSASSVKLRTVWEAELRGPKRPLLDRVAHWRHLANTTERSVRDSDAALCQITLIRGEAQSPRPKGGGVLGEGAASPLSAS